MARFRLIVTDEAGADLEELQDAITNTYLAPQTAKKYLADLNEAMMWLETGADSFREIPELYYQFGFEVRRLNFKKMAIIYSIRKENVYIHRVIPQSMVIY